MRMQILGGSRRRRLSAAFLGTTLALSGATLALLPAAGAASVSPVTFPRHDGDFSNVTAGGGGSSASCAGLLGIPGVVGVEVGAGAQNATVGGNITVASDGSSVSWNDGNGDNEVVAVAVKGGNGFNLYSYAEATAGDTGLVGPANGGDNSPAVSHIVVCYGPSTTTTSSTTSPAQEETSTTQAQETTSTTQAQETTSTTQAQETTSTTQAQETTSTTQAQQTTSTTQAQQTTSTTQAQETTSTTQPQPSGTSTPPSSTGDLGLTAEPDLSINKSVSAGSVTAGGTLNYTISVTNSLTGAEATKVKVVDDVPAALGAPTIVSLTPGWSCVVEGQKVTCVKDTMAPGESATFVFKVTVPANAATASIKNVATVTPDPIDADVSNNTDDAVVTLQGQPAPVQLPVELPRTGGSLRLAGLAMLLVGLGGIGLAIGRRRDVNT
jgi:hypothetical protein